MLNKTVSTHCATLVGVFLTTQAHAQGVPGWTMCWGTGCGISSVPLSPWLSLLISLVLAAVGYLLIRRRSKGLASLAALCMVLAGLSGYEMQKAWAARPPDFALTSPSGSQFEACDTYDYLYARNLTSQALPIKVTAAGGVGSSSLMSYDCRKIAVLPSGETCDLPCLAP